MWTGAFVSEHDSPGLCLHMLADLSHRASVVFWEDWRVHIWRFRDKGVSP